MVKVHLDGQMGENMKELGLMDDNMARESILTVMVKIEKDSGSMEKGIGG